MIASLRGTVLGKDDSVVVLEAGGVGYEVLVTRATAHALPDPGGQAFLLVVPSYGLYGGGETLYGFLTAAEKQMFMALKDEVPSTGAKKALEYLDKASRSLPDFRRAILDKDTQLLTTVFGFTKKTADRLIESLKDKLETVPVIGAEKLARSSQGELPTNALSQALNALASLGYKPSEAKAALSAVAEEAGGQALAVEAIIRLALKKL
ncbi:MAG: Holliday junction branch migration protein RuvA [Elusimicrobia bacterium]|nr:Holliday junction branch migration protein RuvA [Elusimicrobiota bacterium]